MTPFPATKAHPVLKFGVSENSNDRKPVAIRISGYNVTIIHFRSPIRRGHQAGRKRLFPLQKNTSPRRIQFVSNPPARLFIFISTIIPMSADKTLHIPFDGRGISTSSRAAYARGGKGYLQECHPNSHGPHMGDRFLLQKQFCRLHSAVRMKPALNNVVTEKISQG